jgi:hypothetical protein
VGQDCGREKSVAVADGVLQADDELFGQSVIWACASGETGAEIAFSSMWGGG